MTEEKENLPLFEEEDPAPAVEQNAAPSVQVPPAVRNNAHAPHCSSDFLAGGSFGITLRQLREKAGRTLQDISNETRIPVSYLQALEDEDCKMLPQPVYVLGFIRKLCSIYGIPGEQADELTAGLREKLEYELPADINKSVVDREFSEENERKLHQLTILLGIAVILVIAGLAGGTILLVRSLSGNTPDVQVSGFNPETLLELQQKPKLQTTELEIP